MEVAMTTQGDSIGHSLENVWAELSLLVAVAVIVLALTWQYVW
jgi:hypothetical protein